MQSPEDSPLNPGRRRALSAFVNGSIAAIGGALAAVLGLFAVRPATGAAAERWIRAGTLDDLTPDVPIPRVLSVASMDGWYRARVRRTVYLVWDGAAGIRALSATCTHLGCQVLWDNPTGRFNCPCHGGAFDAEGRVSAGPPPRPLDTITVRVEGADRSVLVRL